MAGVVFDTSALIALFDRNNEFHEPSLDNYLRYTGSPLPISAMTYAEFLVLPSKIGQLEAFVQKLADAGFEVHSITSSDAEVLAEVRATSKLKMPDACVLSLAKTLNASLITADLQLGSASRKFRVSTIQL